jgi:hypothetical protein
MPALHSFPLPHPPSRTPTTSQSMMSSVGADSLIWYVQSVRWIAKNKMLIALLLWPNVVLALELSSTTVASMLDLILCSTSNLAHIWHYVPEYAHRLPITVVVVMLASINTFPGLMFRCSTPTPSLPPFMHVTAARS